jgi:hypothetical protein
VLVGSRADEPAADHEQSFARLLAVARQDPEHADFQRLRLSFAATRGYHPDGPGAIDPTPVESELGNGERAAALVALDRVLLNHWTDIAAHDYAISVCQRISHAQRERLHRTFLEGLARSILDSGDGRTPESAWRVISDAEEALLLHALRASLEHRESLDHQGHALHRLTVRESDSSATRALYINVDIPHGWRSNHAQRPEESPAP